jgi:hypothetical protein
MNDKIVMKRVKRSVNIATIVIGVILASFCFHWNTIHADGPNDKDKDKRAVVRLRFSNFELTVHRRGNPAAEPFAVIGMLTLQIEKSGRFTGEITPSLTETDEEKDAVIFRGTDLSPDPTASTRLDVVGQLRGVAINMIIYLGDGTRIFAVGTAEQEFSISKQGGAEALGVIGGPATGPESGDSGDWITSFFGTDGGTISPTCSRPVIKNAVITSTGRIGMDAAGSCIKTASTVRVQVPFSTITFGPFSLQFDSSGAFLVGVYNANLPPDTF